jgi:hypothetical protein
MRNGFVLRVEGLYDDPLMFWMLWVDINLGW